MELGAKYIILQNNDTEVYEGWLDRIIEVAESDPRIGLVGPITSPCRSWQSINNIAKKIPALNNLPKYNNDPGEYARIIKEKYQNQSAEVSEPLAFFSTLIKPDTIEEIGILSEDYGIGFRDDDDYCTRAMNADWKTILALDVFIFHNHRTTFRSQFLENDIDKMIKENKLIFREKCYNNKKREGKKSFKIIWWIFKYEAECEIRGKKIIVKKAWNLYKRKGLIFFLFCVIKYALYGRPYFSTEKYINFRDSWHFFL